MGYTTEFQGTITVEPALSAEDIAYLKKFADTRRMDSTLSPYYVDRGGFAGQDHTPDVIDYNRPPPGQPGLWCKWEPTEDGTGIEWNGAEKFYDSAEWMAYLIDHFVGRFPKAKGELSFLKGHTLNGTISAQGEEPDDMWLLHVKDNVVSIEELTVVPSGDVRVIGGDDPYMVEAQETKLQEG